MSKSGSFLALAHGRQHSDLRRKASGSMSTTSEPVTDLLGAFVLGVPGLLTCGA